MEYTSVKILCLFLVIHNTVSAEFCNNIDKCICLFENGEEINLNTIVTPIISPTIGNLTYYFHPCSNTKLNPDVGPVNKNECDDYSLCLRTTIPWINNTTNIIAKNYTYKNLGIFSEGSFKQEVNSPLKYVYIHNENQFTINLVCAKTSNAYLVFKDASTHTLDLFSPVACPKMFSSGHGWFFILFMILLTSAATYLLVGMAVNRFTAGARGVEMIPNLEFWKSLPSRTMNCVDFLRRGCRRRDSDTQHINPNSYDAI